MEVKQGMKYRDTANYSHSKRLWITRNCADTVEERKRQREGMMTEAREKKRYLNSLHLNLLLCILWHCNPLYEQFYNSINHYLSQINLIKDPLSLVWCRTPMELLFSQQRNTSRSLLLIIFL